VKLTAHARAYWRRRKAEKGARTGSNRPASNESQPS
jgi:hypothetical protein